MPKEIDRRREILNASNELLASELLDMLNINYSIIDIDGNYISQNTSARQQITFGKENAENIDPKSWRDCLEVMRNKERVVKEELISGRHLLSIKYPVVKNDESIGIITLSVDISAKKEAKELKRDIKIALEKNKALKTLGGSIAHELRTPLSAIVLGLRRIAKHVDELQLNDKQNELKQLPAQLMDIAGNCQHVINMQLQNIRADEIKIHTFTKFNIRHVIDTALREYPFQELEKNKVHTDYSQCDDFTVHADPVQIKYVLWNLLKNALYYVLAARKGDIRIWLECGDNDNRLHFKDSGLGMPKEVAERIFEQFYTSRTNGTGLGLSFCHMVMESCRGDIRVQSVQGEYTHFIISFPQIAANGVN